MCGIVGALVKNDAVDLIMESLRRLEYRGYDSSGVAVLDMEGQIQRRRAEGKLKNLRDVLCDTPLEGKSAIGHIRWATHGAPNER
ncbi:MAG: glutamine--fructose-6-phosphate aminotransferase, partial [Pseudomonadota bacterium]